MGWRRRGGKVQFLMQVIICLDGLCFSLPADIYIKPLVASRRTDKAAMDFNVPIRLIYFRRVEKVKSYVESLLFTD